MNALMNIPKDIQDKAETLGLELVSTGGGFDYVFKDLGVNEKNGDPCQAIVCAWNDAGSPQGLKDKACINVYFDENWTDWISIPFKTANDALVAMATLDGVPDKTY